jgi:hypothetical protein
MNFDGGPLGGNGGRILGGIRTPNKKYLNEKNNSTLFLLGFAAKNAAGGGGGGNLIPKNERSHI